MNRLILGPRFCFLILIVIVSIISIVPWGFSGIALAEQGQQELSKAESWVVEQIETGNVADLREFSNGEYCVLSGKFIENLLTGELKDARIHRHGVIIKNAIFTETIDLVNAQVHFDTLLTYCRFENDVDLSKSRFQSCLSFANSTFSNADAKASFYCMTVGNSANFSGTVFECAVDFDSAKIGGVFRANGANFTYADGKANFRHMRVEEKALFQDAVFAGPVDLDYSWIGVNFEATRAKFKGRLNFRSANVGYKVSLTDAVFEGPVDFSYSQIGGNFEAARADFLDSNPEEGTKFSCMTVGYNANFRDTIFKGPVYFNYVKIGGHFIANSAKFTFKGYETNFQWMKVEDSALYYDADFMGHVKFDYSQIGRNFEAQEAEFKGPLSFSSVTVGYRTNFSDATFFEESVVNFNNSEFQNLLISKVEESWQTNFIRLHGMTYKKISIVAENTSWEDLLAWVDVSQYSNQPYVQLEAFFKAEGYPERADAVFAAQKRREREEVLNNWLARLGNQLFDWTLLYGRNPARLFWGSVFFVITGSFFFRRECMEPQKKEMEPQKKKDEFKFYSPFWYSLDAFIPFVNLGMESVWKPKRVCAQRYFIIHRFFGWLMIPIGLLAITAIIT